MALQVVSLDVYSAEQMKSNVKARAALSDGTSKMMCMIAAKTFKAFVSDKKSEDFGDFLTSSFHFLGGIKVRAAKIRCVGHQHRQTAGLKSLKQAVSD